MKGRQIQIQEQKTAHQLKLALGNLRFTLEALEKYFKRAYGNNYPSFRSQLYERKVGDDNYPLENSREQFLTQLLIMKGVCKGEPEFFRNEIKKEFHKWFSAAGIDANDCPNEIKNFLFEISEVLEDRGEKIIEEKEAKIRSMNLNPKDAVGLFGSLQEPINKVVEERKDYDGRNWNELGNENRFSASEEQSEQGWETFQRIHQEVAPKQDGFSFYPHLKEQKQTKSQLVDFQQTEEVDEFHQARLNLINNIKQNPWQWRIEELITSVSGYNQLNRELMLIRYDAKIEHNFGNLQSDPGKLFSKGVFSENEWTEIERAISRQEISSSTYYQQQQSAASPSSNPSNSNFGPVAAVISVLAIAGLSVYYLVKPRKIKK